MVEKRPRLLEYHEKCNWYGTQAAKTNSQRNYRIHNTVVPSLFIFSSSLSNIQTFFARFSFESLYCTAREKQIFIHSEKSTEKRKIERNGREKKHIIPWCPYLSSFRIINIIIVLLCCVHFTFSLCECFGYLFCLVKTCKRINVRTYRDGIRKSIITIFVGLCTVQCENSRAILPIQFHFKSIIVNRKPS